MANKIDARVLTLVKDTSPLFRELIETRSAEPGITSAARDYAASLLAEKCGAKSVTVPGRFCEQQDCGPVDLPSVQPCFQLKWGDGPRDQIETEDCEYLCLTACNPYSNVTFKNLTIVVSLIVGPDGLPKPLPDGTLSVDLTPSEEICFGDLGPCSPDSASCVSREVVLKTQGAVEGHYFLVILLSYEVCFHPEAPEPIDLIDFFQFDLVKS